MTIYDYGPALIVFSENVRAYVLWGALNIFVESVDKGFRIGGDMEQWS